jgi:hypothetical protein
MKHLPHGSPVPSTEAPDPRSRCSPASSYLRRLGLVVLLLLAGLPCRLAAAAPPAATEPRAARPQAAPRETAPEPPRSLTVYFPEDRKAAPPSPLTAPRPAPPPESPFVIVGLLLALVVVVLGTMRLRAPLCPRCKAKMARLEPVTPGAPEVVEAGSAPAPRAALETLACPGCDQVMRRRFRTFLLRDPRCPACGQPTKVMRLATEDKAGYLTWGRVRVEEECKSCDFRASTPFDVPPLEAPVRQRPRSRLV